MATAGWQLLHALRPQREDRNQAQRTAINVLVSDLMRFAKTRTTTGMNHEATACASPTLDGGAGRFFKITDP
jgi:hypothetical protein